MFVSGSCLVHVRFVSDSCLGSCLDRVWLVPGFVCRLVFGFVSGLVIGSCPDRVWFVSCLARIWFAFGFVSLYSWIVFDLASIS